MDDKKNSKIDVDKTIIATKDHQIKSTCPNKDLIGCCFNNRYLIETLIGTGGMSDVYRAVDLHLQNAGIIEPFVAIKVLQTQFSNTQDIQQVLIQEALQTQKLSHPNIIRVFDVDSDGEYHFMVMEWLDGESLDQIINSSKPHGISFSKTEVIIKQIANALAYAHKNGVIHTDLKPANIFLTRKGEIKIFDFGVARSLQENVDEYAVQDKNITSIVNGHTPAYASLEQLNGERPCEADDIFALSCIIYELLTSKHPYQRIAANKVNLKENQLQKPKKLNLYKWVSLKQGLALQKNNRNCDINNLIDKLSIKIFPKVLASIVIICACTLAIKTNIEQNRTVNNLQKQLLDSEQYFSKIADYSTLSASEFLLNITKIETEEKLISQALLRKHQQQLIDIFEQKIKNAPIVGNGKFKNIEIVDTILADAFTYYPDSLRLKEMQKEELTIRESLITALIDRLDQLLLQGKYQEDERYNIQNLLKDLALLTHGEEYLATDEAFKLYKKNINTALKEKNYKRLNTLINIGDLVFHNKKDAQLLLENNKKMASAVKELSQYSEIAKSHPNKAIFPHESAEIFYKQDIEQLTEQLSTTKDYKTLLALDKKIAEFAQQFPTNFEPIITLQKQEVSYLFSHANVLMENKSFNKAKRLINRGYGLLKNLENSKSTLINN